MTRNIKSKYERWLDGTLKDSEIFGSSSKSRTMAYRRSNLSLKMPQAGTVINIAVVGAVGLIGYKLYRKLFVNDPMENAVDKAEKKAAETYTTSGATETDALKKKQNELAAKGYFVTSKHMTLANTIYNKLNSPYVDTDAMVKIIKGMDWQTYVLVTIAYGRKNLSVYHSTHVFDLDTWNPLSWFGDPFVGDLNYHLGIVLSKSQLSSISGNLSR